MRFARLGGRPYGIVACPGTGPRICCEADALPTDAAITAAARKLLPEAPPPRVETIAQEDAYWYAHHDEKMLPVLRVVFADPSATWFHIDPATGEILGRLDRSDRLYRWLFNGLHRLDFGFLIHHRPAWDAVVLLLLLGGLLVSVSGIVIGVRRLGRTV